MHDERIRAALIGAVVATVTAVLVGCSSDDGEGGPGGARTPDSTAEPTVTVTPQPDPAAAALPLDAYSFNEKQQEVVEQAMNYLTDDCMRGLGFSGFHASDTYTKNTEERGTTGIGLVDMDIARKYGYRTPGAADSVTRGTGEARDPNETAALYGPEEGGKAHPGAPEGGCSGEARDKLWERDSGGDTDLIGELTQQADDRARGDSRVQVGITSWSACMKEAGYTVSTPWELDEMEGDRWTGPVTSEETTAATTDVACKEKTELADTWTAVVAAYQQQLVEVNKESLDQEKDFLESQVLKAQEVLEGSEA